MSSATVMDRARAVLLGNYKQQPLVAVRGEGVWVYDAEGKRYLDLLGGIATCSLGHCHPQVVAAAKKQLDTLWHLSNVFYTEPQVALAERLCRASGIAGARAFFCNSGGEANEALIKLTRRAQKDRGHPERFEILTFESSFHGRTLATTAATGQPKYQKGFEPLPAGFRHVPYGDLEAVKAAVTPATAAILVEPIQGEGGVRLAPEGFLRGLRELCDSAGLLLLIDEVQTGMGRTGHVFAYQRDGVVPDAFSLAKALGNGLPIGAMICSDAVASALPSGTHGSTFGGNPVAAAAAAAAFDISCDPKMLVEVARKGELALTTLREMARRKSQIVAVRGRGLLLGIEVNVPAAEVVARARERGVLMNLAGEKTVRLAPAFIISDQELRSGLSLLEESL